MRNDQFDAAWVETPHARATLAGPPKAHTSERIDTMGRAYSHHVENFKRQYTWREHGLLPCACSAMSQRIPKTDAQRAMGQRLRRIREIKGLTQQALADIMGVANTAVQAWEAGRNAIDPVGLGWAADALDFTTDYVIRGRIGGVPMDLAVLIQRAERGELAASPRRGRPPSAPRVDTAQSPQNISLRPEKRGLHEPTAPYVPPTKPRSV